MPDDEPAGTVGPAMKTKPFGLLLGLAGCTAVGLALFHLLEIGSCGGYGAPACPDDVTPWIIALPVGLTAAILSTFLGGWFFSFTGVFLAVGLGSMAAGAFGDGEDTRTFAWIFGGAFTFFGLLPVALWLWAKPAMSRKVEKVSKLVATGVRGIGTVTSVRDTGVTINDDPRVEVTMRVEPVDGSAAVERTKTVVVSRVAIPRAGDRFPVWFDRKDPELWGYGTDVEPSAPAEVQDLFERATRPEPAADTADQLVKLNDLRMAGALTDEEFAAAKDRILSPAPR